MSRSLTIRIARGGNVGEAGLTGNPWRAYSRAGTGLAQVLSGLLLNGFSSGEADQMMDPLCAIFIGLSKIIQKKNIEAGNESFRR